MPESKRLYSRKGITRLEILALTEYNRVHLQTIQSGSKTVHTMTLSLWLAVTEPLAALTKKSLSAFLSPECVEALSFVMQVLVLLFMGQYEQYDSIRGNGPVHYVLQVLNQLKNFSQKFENHGGCCPLILGIIYKVN